MLPLEQDIIKKEQVDQNQALPKSKKFAARDNKKYRVETIHNSVIYG